MRWNTLNDYVIDSVKINEATTKKESDVKVEKEKVIKAAKAVMNKLIEFLDHKDESSNFRIVEKKFSENWGECYIQYFIKPKKPKGLDISMEKEEIVLGEISIYFIIRDGKLDASFYGSSNGMFSSNDLMKINNYKFHRVWADYALKVYNGEE